MSEPGVPHEKVQSSRWLPRALAIAALVATAYGCASQNGIKRLADGSYRVECERPLLPCIEPVAKICEDHGYDILSASEDRERYGPSPWQAESVKSSASVRCRGPKPFSFFGIGGGSKPAPKASSSAPPAHSAPPPAVAPPAAPGCVPGTSQACASATGCSGAQVCAADGRSFGPCECAQPAAPVAPSTPAPPASAAAP